MQSIRLLLTNSNEDRNEKFRVYDEHGEQQDQVLFYIVVSSKQYPWGPIPVSLNNECTKQGSGMKYWVHCISFSPDRFVTLWRTPKVRFIAAITELNTYSTIFY